MSCGVPSDESKYSGLDEYLVESVEGIHCCFRMCGVSLQSITIVSP